MLIRKATPADILPCLDIYNYEVRNGVATFDLYERTKEDWDRWYEEHQDQNHFILVAEENGIVIGYATLSTYRIRAAFDSTAEISIYIHPEHRYKGVGKKLMEKTLSFAKETTTLHSIVSLITGGNEASLSLHKAYGFKHAGTLHEVGYKKDAYRDLVTMEYFL